MDSRALSSDVLVVQVVEVARQTLVENILVTQGKVSVGGDRPSGSVDGAGLRWRTIELELSVGNDGTNSSLGVGQNRAVQVHGQGVVSKTSDWDTFVVFLIRWSSSTSRSLDLTIANLRSTRNSLVLDLTITDLVHDRSSLMLNLTVTNLVDNGSSLVLDLTISNLVNHRGCLVLDLTISDLVDNLGGGGWGRSRQSDTGLLLDLAVTNLVNSISLSGSGGGRSRRSSTRSSRNCNDLNSKLVSVVSGGTSWGRSGRSQVGPWVRWDIGGVSSTG